MQKRLEYHFEPEKGWINDPNGLIFYKGQYHIFFQHNPYAPHWDRMHWGHAVSDDLLHWKELPIALYPDQDYENSDGCFSGSAVERDGELYLFYTSVSHEQGQTQSMARSKDGLVFEKYEGNPVIAHFPAEGSEDFRDPKVTWIKDAYYMVCAGGKDGVGKIFFYKSEDLLHWDYQGVLLESAEFGEILECPDFFPFEDKYLLMFSKMGCDTSSIVFAYGDFDGRRFEPISFHSPQIGPHYYAPQTFLDDKGRRIVIGWLFNKDETLNGDAEYAGAFTIPCTLAMINQKLCMFPVEESWSLLTTQDKLVSQEDNRLELKAENVSFPLYYEGHIRNVNILRDSKTIEVFINDGEAAFTYWFANPCQGSASVVF